MQVALFTWSPSQMLMVAVVASLRASFAMQAQVVMSQAMVWVVPGLVVIGQVTRCPSWMVVHSQVVAQLSWWDHQVV